MKLTLKRSGTFKANWSSGNNVCGHGVPGIQGYNFACEIESDDTLDEHGFIVDQLEVNDYFQYSNHPQPSKSISCERMAILAVLHMQHLVQTNSPKTTLYRIKVGIGVIPPRGVKGEAMIYAERTF